MPVRPAAPEDAYQIAEAHITSWQSAYRGIIPDKILDNLSIPKRAEAWDKAILEGNENIFVSEENGKVVGFVSFGPSRDEDADQTKVGEIYAIYLAPHAYRKGFGTQLIETALSTLRQQGFGKVTLWVLDENTAGRSFYEKIGFAVTGESKTDSFKDGTKMYETQYYLDLKITA